MTNRTVLLGLLAVGAVVDGLATGQDLGFYVVMAVILVASAARRLVGARSSGFRRR